MKKFIFVIFIIQLIIFLGCGKKEIVIKKSRVLKIPSSVNKIYNHFFKKTTIFILKNNLSDNLKNKFL